MSDERVPADDLLGFGPPARRAVERAEQEAHRLHHDRVGTEHLLLGLMLDEDGGTAARLLGEVGATLAGVRHKLVEAVGGGGGDGASDGAAGDGGGDGDGDGAATLPRSARATRALGRAVRFSHAARADAVGAEHVLLGVLDVEGTAGQVLRGLGLDVERLRASLAVPDETAAPDAAIEQQPEPAALPAGARCPSCEAPLVDTLTHEQAVSRHDAHTRSVTIFSCVACGTFLGLAGR